MVSDVAAAAGPGLTRPVLFKIRAWNQGVASMMDGSREGTFARFLTSKKVTSGAGDNKLLILYLVFAATITTRYRKDISG
jgi:hypothetical protein